MNTVQIINEKGVPSHVVWILPFEEYKKLTAHGETWRERGTVPHEVVSLMVDRQYSPLKAWRSYFHLTQKEMAGRMGITQGSYSAIEKSRKNQRLTLQKAADALAIALELLDLN